MRGEECESPAIRALGAALHRSLHQLLGRRLALRLALGRDLGERSGVLARYHRDAHIGVLDGPLGHWRDPLQLGVGGVLEVGSRLPLHRHVDDRVSSGLQHLLVDRLKQRLRCGLSLDSADVPLAHLGRMADEDLGQGGDAGIPHERTSADDVAIAMKRACTLLSSVSSGWKATARMLRSRTATGWPPTSASTSTPGPPSSTHGALMKTARSGSSPSPSITRSSSKLCS